MYDKNFLVTELIVHILDGNAIAFKLQMLAYFQLQNYLLHLRKVLLHQCYILLLGMVIKLYYHFNIVN